MYIHLYLLSNDINTYRPRRTNKITGAGSSTALRRMIFICVQPIHVYIYARFTGSARSRSILPYVYITVCELTSILPRVRFPEKGPAGAEAEDEATAGTWPKMKKRRPRKGESSDSEELRPATASLEAPLVLDPRLVDKLDMSLLSKVREDGWEQW